MRFLHTMLRVRDLDAALLFYVNLLGLQEVRRRVDDKNKFTLVFLAAPEDVVYALEHPTVFSNISRNPGIPMEARTMASGVEMRWAIWRIHDRSDPSARRVSKARHALMIVSCTTSSARDGSRTTERAIR